MIGTEGIGIAILGNAHPLGIVLSAFLWRSQGWRGPGRSGVQYLIELFGHHGGMCNAFGNNFLLYTPTYHDRTRKEASSGRKQGENPMIIGGLLARSIQMSTPLIIGALAEVLVERTGVMNIAIEGIFLLGAWAGFVGTYFTGSHLIGLIAAIATGALVGSCYGYITVYLKQHQIVTGTAINILAAGLVLYFYRVLFGVPLLPLTVEPLARLNIPLLSSIPVIGEILFRQNVLTYLSIALIFMIYWLLFKTKIGLVIRSTGANPEAVDAAGINVDSVRFKAVLCSSALCGLAGAFYSIGFLGLFIEDIIGEEDGSPLLYVSLETGTR